MSDNPDAQSLQNAEAEMPASVTGALAEEKPDPARKTLEALGQDKVKHLLSQGLLVSHLINPAHEWLTELKAKLSKEA